LSSWNVSKVNSCRRFDSKYSSSVNDYGENLVGWTLPKPIFTKCGT